jgi:isopentenyl-diphosphate delta-isomerase
MLPELALADIDVGLSCSARLRAPLLITGMTGGTRTPSRSTATSPWWPNAAASPSASAASGDAASTRHRVDLRGAPVRASVVLLANLGLNQAAQQSTDAVHRLVAAVDADALCLHLNPAQELVQAEGDRDFRGGCAALERLSRDLPVPVIAKETGCGVSRGVGIALRAAGVRYVDVSGAGGTSWVRVEMLRGDARGRALGDAFSAWGIPTAASLAMLDGLGLERIASGGMRTGLDMAKGIALGARLCGAALPIYRAYRDGGIAGAVALVEQLVEGLKAAMLLTGTRSLTQLARQPVVLGARVQAWMRAAGHRAGEDGGR